MKKLTTKELINKYLEMLNRAELRRAAALKIDREDIAKGLEDEIYCYSSFIHDLCRVTGDLVISEITTEKYMDIETCYYKTNVI